MDLYEPVLPSITWIYIWFILRVIGTIAIVIILCAIAIYYIVMGYRTWKKHKNIH